MELEMVPENIRIKRNLLETPLFTAFRTGNTIVELKYMYSNRAKPMFKMDDVITLLKTIEERLK